MRDDYKKFFKKALEKENIISTLEKSNEIKIKIDKDISRNNDFDINEDLRKIGYNSTLLITLIILTNKHLFDILQSKFDYFTSFIGSKKPKTEKVRIFLKELQNIHIKQDECDMDELMIYISPNLESCIIEYILITSFLNDQLFNELQDALTKAIEISDLVVPKIKITSERINENLNESYEFIKKMDDIIQKNKNDGKNAILKLMNNMEIRHIIITLCPLILVQKSIRDIIRVDMIKICINDISKENNMDLKNILNSIKKIEKTNNLDEISKIISQLNQNEMEQIIYIVLINDDARKKLLYKMNCI